MMPSGIFPSDIEMIIREIRMLKEEVAKIKEALRKHGIEIE